MMMMMMMMRETNITIYVEFFPTNVSAVFKRISRNFAAPCSFVGIDAVAL